MYTLSDQEAFATTTQELLKQEQLDIQSLEDLKATIRFHDWMYYVESKNIISDQAYDQLFTSLKDIEAKHPDLITADSPTQRVARGLSEGFETVDHSVPMLSLDNSYNAEDLSEFDRKLKAKTAQDKIQYTVEPKYDGSSIALLYINDQLVRAATRGDGVQGENITNNAKVIKSIPLSADFSKIGIHTIELRGEVVIEESTFHSINVQRAELGLKQFQNSRNTASGGLRVKDPADAANRGLEAFIYQIGYAIDQNGLDLLPSLLNSHSKNIELLHQLGFKVPKSESGSFDSIDGVTEFCRSWENKRATYRYEIDGMVIKADDYSTQHAAGFTAHHPRWAIAFKFKARSAITTLERIEYQVGRTGAVTPVAKLTPIPLAGVTISSVSLHNADFISERDLRLGDQVIVERAGDVIPYIVGAVKEARSGLESPIIYPTECPSCNSQLIRPEGEAVNRCTNSSCPAQKEEQLIHFVSKGAMNIDGLGKDIIRRFLLEGLLTDVPSIYNLQYEEVYKLDGWKEKSVEKLLNNIAATKNQPLWRLLVGLGIRHVGSTTAKMLAHHVAHIRELENWDIEELVNLEDVGPKVAEAVVEYFQAEQTKEMLLQLEQIGINLKGTTQPTEGATKLDGKTFLFTGTLTKMKRDEAKELTESNGGKTVSGVSSKLNYLVAGEKAGSKLKKAQAIPSITILSEEEFLEMIK